MTNHANPPHLERRFARHLVRRRLAVRAVVPLVALMLAAVCVACLGGCGQRVAEPTPLDKIPRDLPVVRIGDKEISGAWLFNWCAMQELLVERGGSPLQVDEHSLIKAGRNLLTKLVVIAMEAERRGIEVSEEELQEKLAQEMSVYESTQAWLDQLDRSGMSREDRKEQIRLEELFNKYRDDVVAPKVRQEKATDELARQFYDTHGKELFEEEKQFHVYHLMRSVARDAPESERQRELEVINKARERIESGESFEDVARELSTDVSAIKGGEMQWMSEDVPMLPELKETVFALEEGQLSDVVESAHGYHLFWMAEVKPSRMRTFEETKEEIKERIFREALKRAMENTAAQLLQQYEPQFLDLKPYIGEPPTTDAPAPEPIAAAPSEPAAAGQPE
ncbi:MAG: peptidylprolyl isomerase [Acidobacteriota bacterium]|nr:MAG: peptidylprolyl isomerase [Acidobacteriota bacterium]